jgi:type II secretory pathway predicted ATPase ExeA
MYDAYWGLKQPLFSSATVGQSLLNSPVHAEALARLDFLRESRSSFGILLGPRGSGKSSVLAAFARETERNGVLVANVNAAGIDSSLVLARLAIGLQLTVDRDESAISRLVFDRLEEIQIEGLPAVVLLDDLDRASKDVIALVEQLLAMAGNSVTVVAAAGCENAKAIGPRLLDLAALRIDLSPWNHKETRDYLSTSLAAAGRMQPAFDESATRRLFELSGGAPRKVNQLAELALLAGAAEKLIQIDEGTIEAVQEELSLAR